MYLLLAVYIYLNVFSVKFDYYAFNMHFITLYLLLFLIIRLIIKC